MSSAVVVTEVEVCNQALGLTGTSRIQSLDEDTGPAIECKARLKLSLNHVLQQHPWQCLTSFALLARLNMAVPPPWSYVYQVPSDSVFVRRVFDEVCPNIHYRTYDNKILCDMENVWVEYSKVMAVTSLPPYLASVVATHLAYVLAASMAHSGVANRNMLYQGYTDELRKARFLSSAESGPQPLTDESWIASRNYTPKIIV